MGFFDFIAEAGEKLFASDADAAESIQKQLAAGFPRKISDLKVQFEDGVATLTGECDCARTKRLAALTTGNLEGVKRVVVDGLTVAAAAEEPDVEPAEAGTGEEAASGGGDEFYVVQKGDTLSGIAKQFYGNAMDYMKIFEANEGVIKDPNLIYPGQKILIPRD